MLGDIASELVIILVLTLANGFFSGSEIAIVSARRSRLESQAKAGKRGAKQAIALSENPDRFLATVQVGITLIGTFSAAFGGARIGSVLATWFDDIPALAPFAETLGLAVVVVVITYLSLVIGELVPKRLALRAAESLAMFAAPIMMTVAVIARPLVGFLTLSVNAVMRLLGQSGDSDSGVTEDDIVYMVREGTQTGAVEHDEAQFIQQLFHFTDSTVVAAMTPRTEVVAVGVDTPIVKIVDTFMESGYSRMPVYDDRIDHILGVLHAKDAMRAMLHQGESVDVRMLLRPVEFVLETSSSASVMTTMRKKGVHLAVVMDEYGQTAGIVTLEDLLEELVGEIHDEHDTSEQAPMIQREDGSWLVDGLESFEKVQRRLDLTIPESIDPNDFTTLAGLLLAAFGRIPATGDQIEIGRHSYEVMDMDGHRVDKVLIRALKPPQDEDDDGTPLPA
jgi:putative hemolysin